MIFKTSFSAFETMLVGSGSKRRWKMSTRSSHLEFNFRSYGHFCDGNWSPFSPKYACKNSRFLVPGDNFNKERILDFCRVLVSKSWKTHSDSERRFVVTLTKINFDLDFLCIYRGKWRKPTWGAVSHSGLFTVREFLFFIYGTETPSLRNKSQKKSKSKYQSQSQSQQVRIAK